MTEVLKSTGIVEYINTEHHGFYRFLIKLDLEAEKKFLASHDLINVENSPKILVGDKVSFEIINWHIYGNDTGDFFPSSLVKDISATKAAVNVQKII